LDIYQAGFICRQFKSRYYPYGQIAEKAYQYLLQTKSY